MIRSRRPQQLERSITIGEPRERVFAEWIRYEELPRKMEGVRRIKCIDPEHVLWDVEIGGRQVVWEARISEVVPPERIAWTSTWGVRNRGSVRFEARTATQTRVTVRIDFHPRGWLETLGAWFDIPARAVADALAGFRAFLHRKRPIRRDPVVHHRRHQRKPQRRSARTGNAWKSSTSSSSS